MDYCGDDSPAAATDEQPTAEQASVDALEQAEAVEDGVGDGFAKQVRQR